MADALAEVRESFRGLPERAEREVHRRAVMGQEALVPERERIDVELDEIVDGHRVAGRLRHLETAREQMLPVHPVAHRRVPEGGLGLRDLVLVMRKNVVDPAGVQVEALAEVARAHRRTLDVPSRETRSPRRFPDERPIGLSPLPKREVGLVALARIELRANTVFEGRADVPRELAVAREAPHREVHGALDFVREAARDQRADDRDHFRHVIGRARKVRRPKDAQASLVHVEGGLVGLGDLFRRLAGRERRRDHLVLAALHGLLAHVADVGDVLYGGDPVPEELERPPQPVREQIRAQVSKMDGAVHRGSARVHAHLAGALRRERDDPALERVIDPKLHRSSPLKRVRRLSGERVTSSRRVALSTGRRARRASPRSDPRRARAHGYRPPTGWR